MNLAVVSVKALTQAHGHLVKRHQAQLKNDAQRTQKLAKQGASKAVSQSKVMLEAKRLEQDAKAIDEFRQQSASDIHDLIARFGHPLVPHAEPAAPEVTIDFNKPFLKKGQMDVGKINEIPALKLAYDAFAQKLHPVPTVQKERRRQGILHIGL